MKRNSTTPGATAGAAVDAPDACRQGVVGALHRARAAAIDVYALPRSARISCAQAAAVLGCSRSTLYRHFQRGLLRVPSAGERGSGEVFAGDLTDYIAARQARRVQAQDGSRANRAR